MNVNQSCKTWVFICYEDFFLGKFYIIIFKLFQELQKVQNLPLRNVARCDPHSKEIPVDPDHDDDTPPTCPKQDTCVTGNNFSLSGKHFLCLLNWKLELFLDPENVANVTCEQCAVWACWYNGVAFRGSGCKGDGNVCKVGSNQDGDDNNVIRPVDYNFFYSCSLYNDCYEKLTGVCFSIF